MDVIFVFCHLTQLKNFSALSIVIKSKNMLACANILCHHLPNYTLHCTTLNHDFQSFDLRITNLPHWLLSRGECSHYFWIFCIFCFWVRSL